MKKTLYRLSLAILPACALAFLAGTPAFAEQRLLYPQEQALKAVSNKLSRIITDFKAYRALHVNEEYSRNPTPALTGMLDNVIALEKEFEAHKLPADHKKIKNIKSWFTSLKKNTPVLTEVYLEGYEQYQKDLKKSDISNFPDYKQDVERLKKMYKAYKNPSYTFQVPEKAINAVVAFQDEYNFFQHLPEKYALPLKANKAGSLRTMLDTNAKYMDKFKAYQDDYLEQLPGKISGALSQATSTAQKAEAEKKPLFFKGGVAQNLEKANAMLALLSAGKGEDAPEVIKMNKAYAAHKQKIDAAEKTMAAELLAGVKMPSDNYANGDKNKLKKMIKKEWKTLYPSDDILSIRLIAADWSRSTNWKWNNSGWYKVDTSVLPARVIVKTDDQIATIYTAFINKNHLKNNALNVGAHTKKAGYITQNMLLKNAR
ncbi:MAG: hypothetical protein JEZ12_15220 [Desulfobacterium sp.]|nr:hypothetical protein [Desulfobacterium sp.]